MKDHIRKLEAEYKEITQKAKAKKAEIDEAKKARSLSVRLSNLPNFDVRTYERLICTLPEGRLCIKKNPKRGKKYGRQVGLSKCKGCEYEKRWKDREAGEKLRSDYLKMIRQEFGCEV